MNYFPFAALTASPVPEVGLVGHYFHLQDSAAPFPVYDMSCVHFFPIEDRFQKGDKGGSEERRRADICRLRFDSAMLRRLMSSEIVPLVFHHARMILMTLSSISLP